MKNEKNNDFSCLSRLVASTRIELVSGASETLILSIVLRGQFPVKQERKAKLTFLMINSKSAFTYLRVQDCLKRSSLQ